MANNNISEMTYEGIKSRGIANDLWAPFERAEAYPMDITSVFGSYETAASYAKNGATSYAGQTIAVAGAGVESKIYKITSNGTLVELVDAIALNLKQDKIEDLDDIRSGAALGVSASQDVSELKSKVSTLVGEDSGKTVRTIANEELASQLILSSATESMNELKDIAAWIQSHPKDAAAMNLSISTLSGLSHTHANKDILDNISSGDVYNWNNPIFSQSAKTSINAISAETSNDTYIFNIGKYIENYEITYGQYTTNVTISEDELKHIKLAKNILIELSGKLYLPCDVIGIHDDVIILNSMCIFCSGVNAKNIPSYVSEGAYIEIDEKTLETKVIITYTYFNQDSITSISADTSNSAITSEMLQCVMSDEYGTYEGSVKFGIKNIYAETNQLELDVDTNINFKKTACFENNIHLGKNAPDSEESLLGGAICFGDDFHSTDGESYPMTYIKEEKNNILDIVAPDGINLKSSKLSVGDNLSINGTEILLLNNAFDSDGSEDEVIFHAFTDDEGISKIKIGVEVDALNIKANNIPNSVKINGVLKPVLNRSIDLGDLINSASTAKIADEAKYVDAKDIDGILGVEHLPIGTTIGSVASGDHTHIEIGGMLNDISGIVKTLTNHEERIQTAEATSLSNKSRIDEIENDCLVLTESKSLKLLTNETFNLGAMSCYNNFTSPIYLAKKSDGTYLTPLDSASTIASTETYRYTFGSGMGAGIYCNGITVRPYEIKTVRLSGRIEAKYLMVKVENAFCTLPSNTNSNGVNKDFGILLSNIDVGGSSTAIRRYCYAIYPGETLAIPLSSANLIPDNFILNNNINDVWSSGTFSPSSILYNPDKNGISATMSHVKDAPTIEYHQQIVGTISDTNLPNNKNIIIDNIQSAHDLRLPTSPKIGKKYEIIHTHKSATLKSGNVNIIRDEGYTNAQSLSASTVSSVIYNGVSWYFYTNLLSNIY